MMIAKYLCCRLIRRVYAEADHSMAVYLSWIDFTTPVA
jgi:hypothetical protein